MRSSVVCITTTSESEFSVHTARRAGPGRNRAARSSPLTLGDSVTQSIRMRFSVHTPLTFLDQQPFGYSRFGGTAKNRRPYAENVARPAPVPSSYARLTGIYALEDEGD